MALCNYCLLSAILHYLISGEVSSWPLGGHFTISVQAYTYTYSVLAPKKTTKKEKKKKGKSQQRKYSCCNFKVDN